MVKGGAAAESLENPPIQTLVISVGVHCVRTHCVHTWSHQCFSGKERTPLLPQRFSQGGQPAAAFIVQGWECGIPHLPATQLWVDRMPGGTRDAVGLKGSLLLQCTALVELVLWPLTISCCLRSILAPLSLDLFLTLSALPEFHCS